MAESSKNRKVAPQFFVPDVPVVSVEHPCIVQNVDRAIRMLGGDGEIADSLEPENQKPLGLQFQPDDPYGRNVASYNQKTNNLLLKVTVPKRTGRKRKRGSNEEFTADSVNLAARKDVSYLLRSLKDNTQRYEAEIVGPIHSTHIWRSMPDFAFSSKGSMFLNEVRKKILPQEYPQLKQWSMPRASASAAADKEAIPPPVFSVQGLPHNYVYRQDTSIRTVTRKFASSDTERPAEAIPDRSQSNKEEQLENPDPESAT